MRTTLQKMGVSETRFMRECDVSLKQGSRFNGWIQGGSDHYYHPFSLPAGFGDINLATYWQGYRDQVSFAEAVSPQSALCANGIAPKQISTPDFAFNVNYGYHLNAGKFAQFLQNHCVENLGVSHLQDHVLSVNSKENGDIESLETRNNGKIEGDLFVDCTGFASILLGKHYGINFLDKRDTLFNDSALALQVPYSNENDAVASHTLSTAQSAGWIWDIGLPSRRGVGHVYSSRHISDENAEAELVNYLLPIVGRDQVEKLEPRKISIQPGHREKFWHKNCVAIGLSAGFVEPLEASALVLIELSAKMLADQFPADRQAMSIVAEKFNRKFSYRWRQIIDFLKLHYVLTKRDDSEYWRDNCLSQSIPDTLQESLELWATQAPWHSDTPHIDEMFPSASFQYVLYGMGFETNSSGLKCRGDKAMNAQAEFLFNENRKKTQKLMNALPRNRDLLQKVRDLGFQKV